jgi:hypothetical protein
MASVSKPRVPQAGGAVAGPGGAVKPDDGVEVDDAAPLILGNLGVGQPGLGGERLAGESGPAGQRAAERDGEPAPQLGGVGVEQDGARVVVALRAQRFPEPVVVAGMLLVAGQADTMRAGLVLPARTAGQYSFVPHAPGVDGPERWRRQRDEHARVLGDLSGDALPSGQPRPG